MKKLVVLLLIFFLLVLMGCSKDGLKDSSDEGAGYGTVIVEETSIEFDDSLSINKDEVDLTVAVINVGGKTGSLDEKIEGVPSGSKTITISIDIDDKKYTGSEKIVVEAGRDNIVSNLVFDEASALTNAWKFVFDPASYGINVTDEVHLVGDLPDANWDPTSYLYSLIEQDDGTWVAIFDVDEGTGFKFMYDSTSWDDGKAVGDNGSNYVVGDYPDVVTQDF